MITRVYEGIPSSTDLTHTLSLKDATALFIVAPDITDELEIDFFLQYELNAYDNRLIRLEETFRTNTVLLYTIPYEITETGQEVYGALVGQNGVKIEVWGVWRNVTLTQVYELLQEVAASNGAGSEADDFTLEQAQWLLQMLQLIAAVTGVPLNLLPLPEGIPSLPLLPSYGTVNYGGGVVPYNGFLPTAEGEATTGATLAISISGGIL